jgi:hypothetical protein
MLPAANEGQRNQEEAERSTSQLHTLQRAMRSYAKAQKRLAATGGLQRGGKEERTVTVVTPSNRAASGVTMVSLYAHATTITENKEREMQHGEQPQTARRFSVRSQAASVIPVLLVGAQADERKWRGRTCTLVTAVCASDANSSTASTASETRKEDARIAKEKKEKRSERKRTSLLHSHTAQIGVSASSLFCMRVGALCRRCCVVARLLPVALALCTLPGGWKGEGCASEGIHNFHLPPCCLPCSFPRALALAAYSTGCGCAA